MINYLVLITTCRKNRSIQEKINNTYLKNVPANIKVLFMEGGYEETKVEGNVLQLAVPDDYENLIYKVQKAYQYALTMEGWDYIVKADDDAYLMLNNISNYVPTEGYDYFGLLTKQTMNGMFYMLSKKAVTFLSTLRISGGNILGEAWGGLKVHCPPEKWASVIPEDSYFSMHMIKQGFKGFNISDRLEFVKYIGTNMKEPNWAGIHPEVMVKRSSLLAFFDVEEYEFEMYYKNFIPTRTLNTDYIVMVCTCRKNKARIDQIRKTWALNCPSNVKVIYLIGGYNETRLNGDILESKVNDSYKDLIYKVQDGYKYLSENGNFKYLIKCDDDVYVNLNKVSEHNYKEYDIIGRIWDGIHMCGPLYILKNTVVKYLAEHTIDSTWENKNIWVGLMEHYPDKKEWKNVIPEDFYFSEVLNKTSFKRQNDPNNILLIKYGKEENKASFEEMAFSIGFFDVDVSEFKKYKKEIEKVNLKTRIAFGIIAHKNLSNVNNLITQVLQNSNHHIFVYVDKKCTEDIRTIRQHNNVHIIKKTKNIYWGDWTFVHAQLRIMKEIKESPISFDYVSFHSGEDLLLKSINDYTEYLANTKGSNYIECISLPRRDLLNGGKWRYEYNWPKGLIRSDEDNFEKMAIQKIKQKCMEPSEKYFDLTLFTGNRWFTITKETSDYCLNYSITHRQFTNELRKTYLPCEAYFQTIIMGSKYLPTVKQLLPTIMIKNYRTESLTIKNVPKVVQDPFIGRKFNKTDSNLVNKVLCKTIGANYMPVHFVWMDKTGNGLKFWHYVALKSFLKYNKNKRVIVHVNEGRALDNRWLTELKDDVEFRFIPNQYIKPNLKYFSHNVDFYRYNLLFEEGGAYIDFDTITMGNIDFITNGDNLVFSSCHKNKYEFSGGFFVSPKANHPLLKDILTVYKNDYRPNDWIYNATYVPGQLARGKYQNITTFIADRDVLFPIRYEPGKDVMKYEQRNDLLYLIRTAKKNISVHFYNAEYNAMLEGTDFENYKTNKTIYALVSRIALDDNWTI